MAVTTGDTDEPIDRTFYLDAFAVVTEQSWVYRSVPHHFHIREINATGHAGLLEELRESLADVRGSTVVPFGGLISWEADSTQYELVWDALRQSDGGEGYVSYDLERLKHVAMHPQEHSLVFEWESASEEPLLRRAFWRFFDPETATPPRRIVVPDRQRRREVLSAFRRLRRDLDYQYTVEADSTE
ncbi:hypothetical protein C499_12495 [Halogeometricum borinquense DSM 11551]|uniref:Uncharacterized protein n=1 Tax=Halogeometricum borinquense (strain ATCC 700274 / DSM 11551 / JCM 10706 / KCTC 4070 / PR3) TaxID=469382 RepID=E4NWG9_HALBP|nr:hypothetical protein Hbor_36830 [Halogeometricum borinquense DSM 11551]ELY26058.1 hypothetical protein C499_12495 [Halogeometricum borinquense DSM 11551]